MKIKKPFVTWEELRGLLTGGELESITHDHGQYILHSLADAAKDFLVASGNNVFAKQTAAQVMASLSGEAAAAFSFNNKNLSSVGTVDLVGGQIKFPATAVPSGDANTQDDFREGTYTCQLSFAGNHVGMAGTFTGFYQKVGRVVYAEMYISLTNKGTSVGTALIELPFPPAYFSSGAFNINAAITYTGTPGCVTNPFGGTTMGLRQCTEAGNVSALTNVNFANNSSVVLTCLYYV